MKNDNYVHTLRTVKKEITRRIEDIKNETSPIWRAAGKHYLNSLLLWLSERIDLADTEYAIKIEKGNQNDN